jgi:hypothetical protein
MSSSQSPTAELVEHEGYRYFVDDEADIVYIDNKPLAVAGEQNGMRAIVVPKDLIMEISAKF